MSERGAETQLQYQALFYADLVLRGEVISVSDQTVPAPEVEPGVAPLGAFTPLRFVSISVDEVLRGFYSGKELEFVVNMGRSDLAGRYAVGDKMVVDLTFQPNFRGGRYFLFSNQGRFVFEGSTWVRQGEVLEQLSIEEIRNIVAPYNLDAVLRSADCVVVGTLREASERRIRDPADARPDFASSAVWVATMDVDQVVKGEIAVRTIYFEMFGHGSYWPSWASVGPRQLDVGNKYLVTLNEIDGKLVSSAGINGLLTIDADGRFYRRRQPLPIKLREIERMAQE